MEVRPLSESLRKIAAEELNEDPKKIPFYLKAVKDWLQGHPQLQSIQASDQWLMAFLRGSKYNLEKCKSKLEKYYTLKSVAPEFFDKRDPLDPSIQELLKAGIFLPLKNCVNEDGSRPCLVRLSELYNSKRSLSDVIKISFMIEEIMLLEDDNFTISGQDVIVDTNGVSFALLAQFTPNVAKKTFLCAERALTVRIKSIFTLNTSRTIMNTIAVIKMLISRKIRNRIMIYSQNYEKLYEYIPEAILPMEYGGVSGDIKELIDYWKNKVESYRSWFLLQDDNWESVAKTKEHDMQPAVENTQINRNLRTLGID